MADSTRVVVEVTAGLIPGQPDPEHTRRWTISDSAWNAARNAGTAAEDLAAVNGCAIGYATMLMLQPERLNWVRTDWIWL